MLSPGHAGQPTKGESHNVPHVPPRPASECRSRGRSTHPPDHHLGSRSAAESWRLHAAAIAVRVRRPGAAHRRQDDGDPSRPASQGLRRQPEQGPGRPESAPRSIDGALKDLEQVARGDPQRRQEQRRRPRQPLDVLADHVAQGAASRRRHGDDAVGQAFKQRGRDVQGSSKARRSALRQRLGLGRRAKGGKLEIVSTQPGQTRSWIRHPCSASTYGSTPIT